MSAKAYKIRPLKWRRKPGENGWFADTSLACYAVVNRGGLWWSYADSDAIAVNLPTMRAAKAECQDHFERAVRVLLIPVRPSPHVSRGQMNNIGASR